MTSIADFKFNDLLRFAVATVCLSVVFHSSVIAGDEIPATQQPASVQAVYARVGDREITLEQYNQTYTRAVRQRFYHSKPPEAELDAVRQEIADALITRELLLIEAERTGIQPDQKNIKATLEQYDQRYADSPRWQQERVGLLGALKLKLEQDDLLRQMENKVKNVAPPTEKQVRATTSKYPEKFTEPMRQKLSLILLVVDPSSSNEVWQAATGHRAGTG